ITYYPVSFLLSSHCSCYSPVFHSFPTRRSSDLGKLAVFIPFRMLCHIFLPELLQGTPRLFHLFLDICKLPGKLFIPVFFRLAVLGKKLFQVLSLKGQELCVPQPKLLEPPDIPVHCFPVDSH